MRHQKIFLIFFFILGIGASVAHAEGGGNGPFYISPDIFYSTDLQQKSAKADSKTMLLDLRLGYEVDPGIYVGLIYGMDNKKIQTTGYTIPTDNYTNTYERTSYGPTVAYVSDIWYVLFAYHYSSVWKVTSVSSSGTTDSKYSGSGLQFDFGVKFPVWGVQLAPQLSYKMFTYSKMSQGGSSSSVSPALTETKLDPSLSVWFFF